MQYWKLVHTKIIQSFNVHPKHNVEEFFLLLLHVLGTRVRSQRESGCLLLGRSWPNADISKHTMPDFSPCCNFSTFANFFLFLSTCVILSRWLFLVLLIQVAVRKKLKALWLPMFIIQG